MGTCSRCSTPRTFGERCQFCGLSYTSAVVPPPPPVDALPPPPPVDALPSAPPAPPAPPAAPVEVPPRAYVPPPPPATYHEPFAVQARPWVPPAPTAGSGTDSATVAWSVGRVLGPYLLACVFLTTIVAAAVGRGYTGSPVDWFRGGVIVATMGLHGKAYASVSGGGGEGSFHLGFTPLLLLAGVLALTYVVGVQAEQRALSRSHLHAVTRAILSGLAMTVALALLALTTRFTSGFGIDDLQGAKASFGAQLLPLFLYAFPLLAGGFAAGRGVTHRAVNDLPTLGQAAAVMTRGVSDWLQPVAVHMGLSGAVLAVVAFVYGLADGTNDMRDVSLASAVGVLVYALMAANIGVGATGLFMGMSLHSAGSESFFGNRGDQSFGLVHGDLSGVDLLWFVLPLAFAIGLGVRRAYRAPAAAWWQAGVASLVLWSVVALLVRATFSFNADGVSMGGAVGFQPFTLALCAFGYGVLLQLGGRALAGPLLTSLPGLARFLGYRPPVPVTSKHSQFA